MEHCIFCQIDSNREIVLESEFFVAIYDIFPVSKGHLLIVSKRHCESFFELNASEQIDAINQINVAKKILDEKYHPDAYNIGVNDGASAGQTIPHVHIHLIPRYKGDMENPRGGVRGVIPEKQQY